MVWGIDSSRHSWRYHQSFKWVTLQIVPIVNHHPPWPWWLWSYNSQNPWMVMITSILPTYYPNPPPMVHVISPLSSICCPPTSPLCTTPPSDWCHPINVLISQSWIMTLQFVVVSTSWCPNPPLLCGSCHLLGSCLVPYGLSYWSYEIDHDPLRFFYGALIVMSFYLSGLNSGVST